MKSKIMAIFTRTPLHVGAGTSVGAVDQPVIRERHTGFPIIPGSAIKGVSSDLWNEKDENGNFKAERSEKARRLFGSDDSKNAFAGSILIGEAKILAFPVRSAKKAFAWITCPLALQRFARDANKEIIAIPENIEEMTCYGHNSLRIGEKIILEEYAFEREDLNPEIAESLSGLVKDPCWSSLSERLVIVSDEMFAFYVNNACEVITRTKIDDNTGTVASGALFNQELIPSETLFYSVIGTFKSTSELDDFIEKIELNNSILQFGANESIGLGYCSINFA